jgi:PAS domain S-box-containing protein
MVPSEKILQSRIRSLEKEIRELRDQLNQHRSDLPVFNGFNFNDLTMGSSFLKNVFDAIQDGISILDPELNIVSTNSWMEKMYANQSPLQGKKCFQAYHQRKTACEVCPSRNTLKTGKAAYEIVPYTVKGETAGWIELSTFPVKDERGDLKYIIEYVKDVTDKHRAEQKLKETSEKLTNIMIAANDGMWDWDLKSNVVEFDPRYFEMAGYAYEEFPSRLDEFQKRVHPDDIAYVMREAENHLQGKTDRFIVEFRFKKKNGGWLWIMGRGKIIDRDEKGNPLRLMGTHTDISNVKAIEEQALKLSKATEQSPASIVITDSAGRIEYVNPRFTNMTGFTSDEVIGKTPAIQKSGVHSDQFYENLWKTITGGKTWYGEFQNKKKDGSIYWEKASISPLVKDDGEITHFISVKEDISERKKILQDLEIAKEKAEESDRLKSAFLANMSHEIRTPMNGILGFATLLKTGECSIEKQKEYIAIIEKSGNRMLSTINDLIDISKIEAGQMEVIMEEVNLNVLLRELFTFFNPQAEEKRIKLSYHIPLDDESADMKTDREKLFAIYANLIKNAIKYTQRGSIDFGYTVENNTVQFFVRDTGIGIPADKQDIIFNRFVQADLTITKPYEGAGLGLSITRAYVDMLEGNIWLDSTVDEGTTFYFTLPFVKEQSKTHPVSPIPKPKPQHNSFQNLTVLVVEDDDSNFLYLKELLRNKVHRIHHIRTGKEAIKACSTDKQINMVLMDIKLPDIDGFEVTSKIRQIRPDLPIIAQTAFALVGDREKALDAGCNDYITKPILKEKLFEAMMNHIE